MGAPSALASTELTAPSSGGPAAACAPVDPTILAERETAFEAIVVSVADGEAHLEVQHTFVGQVDKDVIVTQSVTGGGVSEFGPAEFVGGKRRDC
ncbi:hypothetical protein GCM10010210_56230 [Pseudonocardia hydrocarbonoxydans]|uniref:Uncharacterized protein n=1 Tax=Pseudonocardia hydrocarbonoxydans TaxID=76726 RepID=A0A4Y3WW25_9PSEU|nr:hypothetical protein PHY01_52470 [Pseudonocardia hydrocarbonoxydans]